jgi:hypothetical protein
LEAGAADWKFIGGTLLTKTSGETLAYYDSERVQYLSNGTVGVWIKAVDASEVDRLLTNAMAPFAEIGKRGKRGKR